MARKSKYEQYEMAPMKIDRQQLIKHIYRAQISERGLAKEVGISHTAIQKYISGDLRTCRAATALKIEDALNAKDGVIFVEQVLHVAATRRAA